MSALHDRLRTAVHDRCRALPRAVGRHTRGVRFEGTRPVTSQRSQPAVGVPPPTALLPTAPLPRRRPPRSRLRPEPTAPAFDP